MSREDALKYLRTLSEAELAPFFEEAFEHMAEGTISEGRFVYRLAQCFWLQNPKQMVQEPPCISLVASPTLIDEYIDHHYMDQSGSCPVCHVEVCCGSKLAVCPLCKTVVPCT